MNYGTDFGAAEAGAVFELGVAFREVYDMDLLLFWYRSIGMHFALLRVEFEGELSILILKTRGNSSQKSTTGNRKVS
jgi:hypothetical protein